MTPHPHLYNPERKFSKPSRTPLPKKTRISDFGQGVRGEKAVERARGDWLEI